MTASLTLNREINSDRGVLGTLATAEGQEVCKTLELPWRNNLPNVSCIVPGTYTLIPYTSDKHPHAFHVTEVPGRSNVLIHAGNYVEHSQGCILVGESWQIMGCPKQLAVADSRKALRSILEQYPAGFRLTIY